jgi:hypothetical protein
MGGLPGAPHRRPVARRHHPSGRACTHLIVLPAACCRLPQRSVRWATSSRPRPPSSKTRARRRCCAGTAAVGDLADQRAVPDQPQLNGSGAVPDGVGDQFANDELGDETGVSQPQSAPRRGPSRRSAGHGLRPCHREDRRLRVLARRSVSRPEEISYCIAYCPAGTTLDELIRIAGSRWAIEECFQTAKRECGLDDYQVRRYPGWLRHMTLARAAHACPTVLRVRQLQTDAEIRRLITRLTRGSLSTSTRCCTPPAI